MMYKNFIKIKNKAVRDGSTSSNKICSKYLNTIKKRLGHVDDFSVEHPDSL